MIKLVEIAGFNYINRLLGGGLKLDRVLITTLVERWKQETHIFHLTIGEATITLQDVVVILGLPIDGHLVTGHGHLVFELLRVFPENPRDPTKTNIITGSSLKLTLPREHFNVLGVDADDVNIERHARAYILYFFGCILFPDKSRDFV